MKLRSLPIIVALFLFSSTVVAQSKKDKRVGPVEFSEGGKCDTSEWKLVFHDEFGDPVLDRSKWVTYFTYSHDGSDQCEGCRTTGSSNTIYRDEQVSVSNGSLVLSVEAKPGTWYGRTMEHESGMIHSIGAAKFTYGRFEVRCKIPGERGLWPAFWGFGGETEIDVFEFCGEEPRTMKASLHRWGAKRASNTGKHKAQDLSKDFHTYAVEWEPDEIRWYLDGEQVHSRGRFVDRRGKPLPGCDRAPGENATAPYYPLGSDGVNVILNLSVSPPNDYCKGPVRPDPWPAGTALLVDHVRVYQRKPQPALTDLCTAPRRLEAEGPNTPLKMGAERRFSVAGPHGNLTWTMAPGLTQVSADGSSITVRANGSATGEQWLRVESLDDPCPRGPLMLEIGVVVAR